MFANIFGSIGTAIFGELSIGGVSLGKIGRLLGSKAGSAIDKSLKMDNKRNRHSILTPHDLDMIGFTTDDPDDVLPLIYGTVRLGGHVLWVSPIETKVNKSHLFSGKWGIFPQRGADYYTHSVSVAIAICEGEIDRITNIYVNDRLLDTDIVTRIYTGTPTQTLDPLIEHYEGTDTYPPFRHTAYVVIEDIPIDLYQKNLPNFTFDVVKGSEPKIENAIQSLCLIPASGEFVYATDLVQREAEFAPIYENVHTPSYKSDFSVCVQNLQKNYPNLKNVSLVVGWFFNHIDPLYLTIMPAVETLNKVTSPLIWSVDTYNRSNAWLISHYNGGVAYGGTPSDESVKQGMIALYQAGYKVTFYPFLFGDIVPDNPQGLPAFPWRGRISPTGTDTQKQQGINHFFTQYSAMIVHYAHLCKSINNQYPNAIDLFVIGSELKELTRCKINGTYPAVAALKNLAMQVRAILGNNVKITYGADWSEGGSYNAPDGMLDFPLDDLWSDNNIDYIAYDWYPPLTDWRDGDTHLDRAIAENDRDADYLQNNIEGGEGYDYYYATQADRDNQIRTPITDGAYNKPWIHRIKDIRSRWLNYHYPRNSAGIELATPTAWIPQSKPIIFTEIGCPAVNKGGNSPNLFPDAKSSENAIPPYSTGQRDDFIQRALIKAYLDYWQNDITGMIDHERSAIWCVDARPFPQFPARSDIWRDSDLFMTGHWIDGRGGFTNLKDIMTNITQRAGLVLEFDSALNQVIDGYVFTKAVAVNDMLSDLVHLFDLHLTNHNDLIKVVNGKKGVFYITDNMVVRLVDGGQGTPKNNVKKINQTQKNTFSNYSTKKNSVGLSEIPNKIETHFLDLENDGKKAHFTTQIQQELSNNTVTTTAMTLPIVGFSHYLKTHFQNYLYKIRAGAVSLELMVYQIDVQVGQIVTYQSKQYRILAITYDNMLMTLTLQLYADYMGPPKNANNGISNTAISAKQYVLSQPIINHITLDNQSYIGLYARSHLKPYHLYKTPHNGTIRDYVGLIQPTMIYGETVTDFYNRPTNILDIDHDLWVILPNGDSLTSLSQADMVLGGNRLAIYNIAADLWELISFETATLVDVSLNKYHLSKIRRGLNNTQSAMGSPVAAGAKIVLFTDALQETQSGFDYDID